jgi:hypothetical protein
MEDKVDDGVTEGIGVCRSVRLSHNGAYVTPLRLQGSQGVPPEF